MERLRIGIQPHDVDTKRKISPVRKIAMSAGLMALALLPIACNSGSGNENSPTPTPLVIAGIGNGDFLGLPATTSITFSEDKAYAGDSIKMNIGFTGDEYYTVVAQEQQPKSGTLVADSYLVAAGQSETTHPLINLNLGDVEMVYVGVGSTPDETFNNMLAYRFTKSSTGISGSFVGYNKFDPKTLKLRDNPLGK